MEEGDMLFQYTDGVTECSNSDGKLFGTERLLSACEKAATDSTEDFLHDIWNSLEEFEGTAEQFDDITMLCFQYRPARVVGFIPPDSECFAFLVLGGQRRCASWPPRENKKNRARMQAFSPVLSIFPLG